MSSEWRNDAKFSTTGGRRGGFHFLFPFLEPFTDPVVNLFSADYIAGKTRGTVEDPATAEPLIPGEDAPPCRRAPPVHRHPLVCGLQPRQCPSPGPERAAAA